MDQVLKQLRRLEENRRLKGIPQYEEVNESESLIQDISKIAGDVHLPAPYTEKIEYNLNTVRSNFEIKCVNELQKYTQCSP